LKRVQATASMFWAAGAVLAFEGLFRARPGVWRRFCAGIDEYNRSSCNNTPCVSEPQQTCARAHSCWAILQIRSRFAAVAACCPLLGFPGTLVNQPHGHVFTLSLQTGYPLTLPAQPSASDVHVVGPPAEAGPARPGCSTHTLQLLLYRCGSRIASGRKPNNMRCCLTCTAAAALP
jgi:hypothetical protein